MTDDPALEYNLFRRGSKPRGLVTSLRKKLRNLLVTTLINMKFSRVPQRKICLVFVVC